MQQETENRIFQTISHELGTCVNFLQQFISSSMLDQNVGEYTKTTYLSKSQENEKKVDQQLLIINEEEVLANNISENLILTAYSGKEAVDIYRKMLNNLIQIKLIFMDINMPIMDGFEATKEIRKIQYSNKNINTHIIGYSSWTDLETRYMCEQCGMDTYYPKPISPDVLGRLLSKYYFNELNL
ncbi:hypothetical protein IMG5_148710 [Ichthyophthirius multifiliis]|uniref:Response regulatory domain-containing protein n=1 Tax=Ichthyophthirius multifiliis TaxID=5932 RepID=G0QYC6_ICHMU|nr:hypothetical protein IMG5_148710 [Ichthyophthirius multifiliis]EGR29789.1 hypothetical protein IMG5_148710 [Ichthyophthirius multifiliis]|eukprot:XP_004031025.1 hypothetical protein IMG5_148710 [Ichthyophthirius multifiliis]